MFKPRYAIAFGILVIASVAVVLLRRYGVEKDILAAVMVGTLTSAWVVALGGKCGRRCRGRCADDGSAAVASWLPFIGG
jgi:hypothetical protein